MHTRSPCTQNTHAQSVNLKNVVRKRGLEVKFARLTQRVQSSIRAIWGAMVAQWWEHKWPWFKAICGFSLFSFFPLLQEVFLRPVFPSTKKKTTFKNSNSTKNGRRRITIWISATSKSLFVFYSFSFISIFLILFGITILYYSTLKLTLPHNQISCDSFAGQKQKIKKRTDSWKAKCTRTAGASSATSAVNSRFFHHSCIIRGRTGNDSSKWEERAGENHVASWKRQGNWGELTFAKTSGTHVTGNTGKNSQ